jgi:hypothetical protein
MGEYSSCTVEIKSIIGRNWSERTGLSTLIEVSLDVPQSVPQRKCDTKSSVACQTHCSSAIVTGSTNSIMSSIGVGVPNS